ncbi:MAG: M20/M25/M40 family metallo-hydrolase, partial [Bacteroidota bacterium]|nr:M20/M25/M40 family metallo-hydrolase [Bacteroidota bacterium]
GVIKGKAVYIDAKTEADLEKYKGKLKGAIVFVLPVPNLKLNYEPFIKRYNDADIKKFTEAVIPSDEEKKKEKELKESNEKITLEYFRFANKRIEFCMNEGAAAIVEYGGRLYGTNQGLSALLPVQLTSIDELFYAASKPKAPKTLPQILLSLEQYDSIIRTLKCGIEVNLEVDVEVENDKVRKGQNVIAEIPGTDLKNEIVIIGAHIDTQGPSIGATDNAAGVAVCMEAMRLLKQIGAQPRRTIRICLWGGEEQGYLGSKEYVAKHFTANQSNEKCYMYFNTDNGAGKFRGIYMEERSDLVPVMKKWFDKVDMNLITTISKTMNTDHESFNEKGIAGFQFIQDMLDYYRIYHTNMDRIERIPLEDARDNAIIMAGLAYLAAVE